jgi:hypothetical protein
MALTSGQQFQKCCGFYCAMLACVGIYFYLVMALFQSMNNTFVVEELEDFQDPVTAEALGGKKNFTTAFLVTALVSSFVINQFY